MKIHKSYTSNFGFTHFKNQSFYYHQHDVPIIERVICVFLANCAHSCIPQAILLITIETVLYVFVYTIYQEPTCDFLPIRLPISPIQPWATIYKLVCASWNSMLAINNDDITLSYRHLFLFDFGQQLVFWYHFVHKSYMLDSMFLIALICSVFYINGVDKHEDISTRLIFYTTHQFKSSRTIDCEPTKWDNFGWILNRYIVPIVFNITHTHIKPVFQMHVWVYKIRNASI